MKSKIYYNGQLQGYINKDNRFNDKVWEANQSDSRINKRQSKPIRISFKTILWIIFWIMVIAFGQYVDNGGPMVKDQANKVSVENNIKPPIQVVKAEEKPSMTVREMIIEKFGNNPKALAVANCESRLNPNAIGDNYPINGLLAPSIGVFQIRALKGRPSIEELKDPKTNIDFAYKLYQEQGWTPWVTCGRYWEQFKID